MNEDARQVARRPPRLSLVQLTGLVVCAVGLASLLSAVDGRTTLSWAWADAGITALIGLALLAAAVEQDGRCLYAGTCDAVAESRRWPAWSVRAAVVVLAPLAGVGVALYAVWSLMEALRHPLRPPLAIDWRRPVGVGMLGLAWILALRAAQLRIGGDEEIYSVLLIGAGLPLFWSAAGGRLIRLTDRAALEAGVRTGVGLLLALVGAVLVLSSTGLFHQAQRTIAGTAIALLVLALVVGPRWRRTSRLLAEQRAKLERAQDRADLADHLHDSVLQTLALIQRRAADPSEVASLARRQERELRAWLLSDAETPAPAATLSGALRVVAAEIEDTERTRIELVVVGEAPLDEPLTALVAAAREAMSNAVRHGTAPVSVFCRVEERSASVYVHDRGRGFHLGQIPPDRRGVRESIIARTERHGGTASVRVTPGTGCEIELTMPR